jgi:tRNA dimethylallyltransferase
VQGRRCHRVPGYGRRRCRDGVRGLRRVRRLVRVCRGGTRRDGVEFVVAARLDARSRVGRRRPRTRVLGSARQICRRRLRRGQVGRGRRYRLVGRGQVGRGRRRWRVGRGRVGRGRCCRGFRTVLVCGVEPSAVRLRARVLLRHGSLPPPARHDGGRPAAAGPRSAGRRRSMRTVATWDSNSSAPGPKPLRAARRPERWFCGDSRPPRYPRRDLPAGGRRRWSSWSGPPRQVNRSASSSPRPGQGGRQRGRDGLYRGMDVGTAKPAPAEPPFRTTCSTSWTSPGPPPSQLPAGGARGRRTCAAPVAPRCWSVAPSCTCAVVDKLDFQGTDRCCARAGGGAGHGRTGCAAHPPGRRRPRRRGGGAAEQRAPDRAGAGGRGATGRPFPPGSGRAGRRATARCCSWTGHGELDEQVARRRPHVRLRPGRGDPRAARPRPARGPHRLRARVPAGRGRARRRSTRPLGPGESVTVRATRRFVRRQRSWFRRDRRIVWLDPGPDLLGRALRTLGP